MVYIKIRVHYLDVVDSQLHIIIDQANLLARLESWQTNVRASVAPECVSQCAIPARAHFALYCEIDFRQIICFELCKCLVCVGALGRIFCFELLGQTAGTVFACSSSFAGLWATFRGC